MVLDLKIGDLHLQKNGELHFRQKSEYAQDQSSQYRTVNQSVRDDVSIIDNVSAMLS